MQAASDGDDDDRGRRPKRRRLDIWILIGTALSVFLLGVLAVGSDDSDPATGGGSSVAELGTRALRVEVPDVDGLAPGVSRTVFVTVVNEDDQTVRLEAVEGRVQGPARPECPADTLHISGFRADASAPVLRGSGGRTAVEVRVTMPATARDQDACKNVSFELRFTATGEVLTS